MTMTIDRDHKDRKKIGEVISNPGDITQLSAGEFDVAFLKRYEHAEELEDCCVQAVTELADEPYIGSSSHAKVMGRAMELLRDNHGLDAPRGWVPVLRALRSVDQQMQPGSPVAGRTANSRRRYDPADTSSDVEAASPEVVPPELILSYPASTLWHIDVQYKLNLRGTVEADPQLMALFVSQARKLGVPGSYREGLAFMDALLALLHEPMPILLNMREILKERAENMGIVRKRPKDGRE